MGFVIVGKRRGRDLNPRSHRENEISNYTQDENTNARSLNPFKKIATFQSGAKKWKNYMSFLEE